MFGKIALIEFVLMLAMAGAGVSYFRYTEAQINTLHENNAKLETAVNVQKETIAAQQAAAAEQAKQMLGLQQHMAEAESARKEFEAKLRQKDLSAMARANAADLESRMNRATQQVLQDIINLTTPKDRPTTPQQLAAPAPAAPATPTPTDAKPASSAPASATPAPQPAAPATQPAPKPADATPAKPPAASATPAAGTNGQPPPRPPKQYGKPSQP